MPSSIVLTDDGQIKASRGHLWALLVCADGVTSGDKVEIKDSTDNSGTAMVTVVLGNTDDIASFTPATGIEFGTAIYADFTKTGGTLTVTAVYD